MRRVEANEALEEDDKSCKQTADLLQTNFCKKWLNSCKICCGNKFGQVDQKFEPKFRFWLYANIFYLSILFQVVEFLS